MNILALPHLTTMALAHSGQSPHAQQSRVFDVSPVAKPRYLQGFLSSLTETSSHLSQSADQLNTNIIKQGGALNATLAKETKAFNDTAEKAQQSFFRLSETTEQALESLVPKVSDTLAQVNNTGKYVGAGAVFAGTGILLASCACSVNQLHQVHTRRHANLAKDVV